MLLKVENMSVGYGKKTVLTDINLEIREGEIMAILGCNGAGKTTLFRSIMGLKKLKTGKVEVEGKCIESIGRKELGKIIAYVPQCHNCTFAYPVIDVVVMGRNPYIGTFSEPSKKDYNIAMQALGKLNIEHLAKRSFRKLSGGEKQLVLIARALAQKPKIIIMDEPTASLDFNNSVTVLEQVMRLKEDNLALLITSHSPAQTKVFADRVLMIKEGSVYRDDTVDILYEDEVLHQLYDIDVEKICDERIRGYVNMSA